MNTRKCKSCPIRIPAHSKQCSDCAEGKKPKDKHYYRTPLEDEVLRCRACKMELHPFIDEHGIKHPRPEKYCDEICEKIHRIYKKMFTRLSTVSVKDLRKRVILK